MKSEIKKLALNGLIGGALAIGGVGCDKTEEGKKADPPATETQKPGAKKEADKPDKPPAKKEAPKEAAKYTEIHNCAGKNICKGLGGCKVDAAKLKELAAKVGKPLSEAGQPHACKGQNECKGLGGCSVDEAKLAKLKAALKK